MIIFGSQSTTVDISSVLGPKACFKEPSTSTLIFQTTVMRDYCDAWLLWCVTIVMHFPSYKKSKLQQIDFLFGPKRAHQTCFKPVSNLFHTHTPVSNLKPVSHLSVSNLIHTCLFQTWFTPVSQHTHSHLFQTCFSCSTSTPCVLQGLFWRLWRVLLQHTSQVSWPPMSQQGL